EVTHVLKHPFDEDKALIVVKHSGPYLFEKYNPRTRILEKKGIGKTIKYDVHVVSANEQKLLIQSAIAFDKNEAKNSYIYWGDKNKINEDREKYLFKGTGLMTFVDYLRIAELSKLGIKKWVAEIDPGKDPSDFADFRRFENETNQRTRTRKIPQLGKK
ncbi:MAG: hypothetical protein Q7K42_03015, partial [Candidatus Diapherotrites archaeon]|nr:hypothetical protein [Candidatus Diapherotrites archaeon]